MKQVIISLLQELLADQTQQEVQIDEVYGVDRQSGIADRLHGTGHVGSGSYGNSEVTA